MRTRAFVNTSAHESVVVSCASVDDQKRYEIMVFKCDEETGKIVDYDPLEEHTCGTSEEALEIFEATIEKWSNVTYSVKQEVEIP